MYQWIRYVACFVFGVCALAWLFIDGLLFAGSTVDLYSSTFDGLGSVFLIATGVSGAVCVFLFRRELMGGWRGRK